MLLLRMAVLLLLVGVVIVFYRQRERVRDFWVDDTRYEREIRQAAADHGLDPDLVRAVIFQESRFNAFARGSKGEVGLMQLLPEGAVAEWARVHDAAVPDEIELCNPELNLEIGCWYLARAMRRWQGYREQTELALCQYNAGEQRARRWCPEDPAGTIAGRITIPSTEKYVARIMARYREYKEENL